MRTLHYSFVMKRELSKKAKLSIFKEVFVRIRDVEALKFLMLPLPAPIEDLCFRVCFRFLTFGIFCFRFQVRIELVALSSLPLPVSFIKVLPLPQNLTAPTASSFHFHNSACSRCDWLSTRFHKLQMTLPGLLGSATCQHVQQPQQTEKD